MSLLKIKVVPGSFKTKVDGRLGKSLKIRVTAKPGKGKANDAVVTLLADTLRIPKANVTISSAASSAQKVCKISGLTDSEVRFWLPGGDG